MDARSLQDPDRAPVTSRYLEGLLGGFDAAPIPGESFAFLLRSDLDDPTQQYQHLEVVGRRLLPPTSLLRSGALTIDPFLLRGAAIGAAWRAERSGAAGAVYHAVGGAPPVMSRIPIVVTLLDLAPWEVPRTFQRGIAARFGQRLRAQLIRDAAVVIVGTSAVARAAGRLLHLRPNRVRVIPLAPHPAFAALGRLDPAADPEPTRAAAREASAMAVAPTAEAEKAAAATERERLGLPERYLVYSGRYDARQDLATLLRALATNGASDWPPKVLLVGATPDDRAALARAAGRIGVGEALAYAPALPPERLAGLVRGARAAILPALTDAAGLPAIDALAVGTPVIATGVGALPEIVAGAGIVVEPRHPERLAEAMRTCWSDDLVYRGLLEAARARAAAGTRTWLDVALETRRVYVETGVRVRTGSLG